MIKKTSVSGFLFLFIIVVFIIAVNPSHAVTPEKFIEQLKLKFRRTATIYMEARASNLSDKSDSSTIILAYSYPDQFLQWVRGGANREQILIMNGDSVVLSYPHLDSTTEHSLDRQQRMSILVREVPLAAMMMGVQSDSVPVEDMKTELENGELQVEIINNNPKIPYRRGKVIFDWPHLYPLYFNIESESSFEVEVTVYEEETRFPVPVEKAIHNLEPQLLKGEQP
ncbi:MAG: hypothetical protein ACLFN5_02325 [bacterium]